MSRRREDIAASIVYADGVDPETAATPASHLYPAQDSKAAARVELVLTRELTQHTRSGFGR